LENRPAPIRRMRFVIATRKTVNARVWNSVSVPNNEERWTN
jgi:hypothetical protein